MNIIKKIWLFSILLLFLFPSIVGAAENPRFSDVPNSNEHYDSIINMTNQGMINGYKDGSFKPYQNISREHVAAILFRSLKLPTPSKDETKAVLSQYKDVTPSHEYAKQIAAITKANIFKGSKGYFKPSNEITREQMATVFTNGFNLTKYKQKNVKMNVRNVDSSHKQAVQTFANLNITVALKDFKPGSKLKRGQFASFLARTYEVIANGELKKSKIQLLGNPFSTKGSKLYIYGVSVGDKRETVINKLGQPYIERVDYPEALYDRVLEYGDLSIFLIQNKVALVYLNTTETFFKKEFSGKYPDKEYIDKEDNVMFLFEEQTNQLIFGKHENNTFNIYFRYADNNFLSGLKDGWIQPVEKINYDKETGKPSNGLEEPKAPTITELYFDVSPKIVEKESINFKLNAKKSDGRVEDVTSKASYTTNDPNIIKVNEGIVTGLKAGNATITAIYKGESVQVEVSVTPLKIETDEGSGSIGKENETDSNNSHDGDKSVLATLTQSQLPVTIDLGDNISMTVTDYKVSNSGVTVKAKFDNQSGSAVYIKNHKQKIDDGQKIVDLKGTDGGDTMFGLLLDGYNVSKTLVFNSINTDQEFFSLIGNISYDWGIPDKDFKIKMKIEDIDNKGILYSKYELEEYLKNNFAELETIIGKTKFSFDVYENDNISYPYDYWIKVKYNSEFFYDLQYSNKIDKDIRSKAIAELKEHQESLAKAAIEKMPGKKLTGGYYNSWYVYPNIKVDFESRNYHAWANFDGFGSYEKTATSTFRWTKSDTLE